MRYASVEGTDHMPAKPSILRAITLCASALSILPEEIVGTLPTVESLTGLLGLPQILGGQP